MISKLIVLFLAALAHGAAQAAECKDASLIKYSKIKTEAGILSEHFSKARREPDLGKKMDLFLIRLVALNKVLTSHEGRLNQITRAKGLLPSSRDQRAYQEATENEAARLKDVIAGARHLIKQKKLNPAEMRHLEISVNGLLDVSVARLQSVVSRAGTDEQVDNQLCLEEQGDSSLGRTAAMSTKFAVVDSLLLGYVVNPWREKNASGQYESSLRRVESLVQSHSGGPSTQPETPAAHR